MEREIRPGKEILPVGRVGVASVMLSPSELAIEKASVDGWHLSGVVVRGDPQVLRPEQLENRFGGDCGHEATLLVEPFGIALFRHAIADERGSRRAKRFNSACSKNVNNAASRAATA